MRLDLGEVCVRPFTSGDAAALVRHANNRAVWITLRDRFPHPYTPEDADAFLRVAMTQDPPADFAIASADEVIGGIGLQRQGDVHRLTAEIGYWLGESFWGRGIATRAVRAVTDWAFAATPLERIFAYVFATNPASARVLAKAGYQFEGRLHRAVVKEGRVLDQLVYAALRP
ncbi:MAG: GNAT family N-acetyltransferase [Candidatus Binatia bacterium]